MSALRSPVLVVGAGQGLLVAELRSKGFRCDGLDWSIEMIRRAKRRRGLVLIQADASAMPLRDASYETIIYATGVIDFNSDEEAIQSMLSEGRRVVKPGGKIFVAFYRLSAALEHFLRKTGLLSNDVLLHRESLEIYRLTPGQMIERVREKAGAGKLGALAMMLRLVLFGSFREKVITFKMQKILRKMENPQALIQAAPEKQAYRNEVAIRKLFERQSIPVKNFRTLASCWIVQV